MLVLKNFFFLCTAAFPNYTCSQSDAVGLITPKDVSQKKSLCLVVRSYLLPITLLSPSILFLEHREVQEEGQAQESRLAISINARREHEHEGISA